MLWTSHKFSMAPGQWTSYVVIYINYTSYSNVRCKMAKLKLWGFLVIRPHEKSKIKQTWNKYTGMLRSKNQVTFVNYSHNSFRDLYSMQSKKKAVCKNGFLFYMGVTHTFNKHPCKWSSYFAIVLVLAKFHDHCKKSLQTIKKSINYCSMLEEMYCNIKYLSLLTAITGIFTQGTYHYFS